ncbi:MAG: VgrG-related protein [Chloroflexi bacterium]|uniref:VgrG-related protein n=1 Tax=Candidatus Chlorohelix allophototropha TaxID=3003348 RepID=A0A8T7LZ30_9CHLR|nr:VgrG-related protein [Chloroflexota bacterium]WJW67435.1 VgrG-related protein [Chloroflexota bacterium L227-S17]
MTTEQKLNNQKTIASCHIKIGGSPVSSEIMDSIMSIEVNQTLYLPSMFTIRLHNDNLAWTDNAKFKIGNDVVISMGYGTATEVMSGEITAIELESSISSLPVLTIQGYDKLHRMQRGRFTRTFNNSKDSDLVSRLASEKGLSASASDTSIVHPYILQNNESNLEFLQRRAKRIGMELFFQDGKLNMRKHVQGSKVATLSYGEDLLTLNARISYVDNVTEVLVRGWDVKKKEAIVGKSTSATGYSSLTSNNESSAKKAFGTTKTAAVFSPVMSQSEADKVAEAIFEELSGRIMQVDGSVLGNPTLLPGKCIELAKISTTFSGTYYLTSCIHRYGIEGYITEFAASGKQANTFAEQVGGGENHWELSRGVVIGIVTNLNDPDNLGRVKIKFPWLPQADGQDIESNWARVAMPMAGNNRGFFFMPEVNDEVLVAFEQGDLQHPYIIGALWNGKDAPPELSQALSSGVVKQRLIKSKSGHIITLDESDDKPKISIVDKTGSNKIIIDSQNNTITIESKDKISITSTTKDIELKAAAGKVTLDAKEIEIKSSTNTKISATAKMEVQGLNLEMKASASAKIDGGGMTEIKGGLIKLN